MQRKFDLNIGKVLEDWEVHHALREIIANWLDEKVLRKTKDIKIYEDTSDYSWHIRDYWKWIEYKHLTQNEDDEKHNHPEKVIGKFWFGLKDALATFNRNNIEVLIKSKYGDITLRKCKKSSFDIHTLHAIISDPSDKKFIGTEFILKWVNKWHIELAKSYFLQFSDEEELENTKYWGVLQKKDWVSKIYINWVKIAEEDNLLFSYNITSVTSQIKKHLNRERTNVWRSAYTDRVKSILLECQKGKVVKQLMEDLEKSTQSELHEELKWIDIAVHTCRLLNSQEKKILFVTPNEIHINTNAINHAHQEWYKIITITEDIKNKIESLEDIKGNDILCIEKFIEKINKSYKFSFIWYNQLSSKEKSIFDKRHEIIELAGINRNIFKDIHQV